MFLAINIGNSAVKFGLFEGDKLIDVVAAPSSTKTVEQFWAIVKKPLGSGEGEEAKVEKIGIASVVPVLSDIYTRLAEMHLSHKPYILNSESPLGFKVLYDEPSQVGADRLANIAAARELYGFPAIVVDIGTATTFSVIDQDGDFAGGPIAPGPATAAGSLFEKAAKLFPIKIEKPEKLVATNTAEAMKAGIYYGNLGQIDHIVLRLRREFSGHNTKVVITGGLAELFGPEIPGVDAIDPYLTLRGINLIFGQ
jgi:type III pantothenate kinase